MRAPAHIATVFAVGMSLSMLTDPVSSSLTHNNNKSTFNISLPGPMNLANVSKVSATQGDKADVKTEKSEEKENKPEPKKEVIKIKAGDSLAAIAKAHDTTWVRLFNANKYVKDPNIIHPNKKLTIPNEGDKLPNRYKKLTESQVKSMPRLSSKQITNATSPARVVARSSSGGANKYTAGQCTWYVKNKRPDIGNMWGNGGYGWLSSARSAGFSTGSKARPGAVAVMSGHVAYVESVSGGKVHLSEMNYGGRPGVVHKRVASAGNFKYIY
ncbi:MAG: LysM peptidoglycan-binding domain-containing protein [bacterium]|nr:LysM peptidoglycan-binding domain-containing protein [bacterium]MDN5835069.1 LysM peptidoglycan-binding domain-containing protein [bacterium]